MVMIQLEENVTGEDPSPEYLDANLNWCTKLFLACELHSVSCLTLFDE
jgi:hypothetical protein